MLTEVNEPLMVEFHLSDRNMGDCVFLPYAFLCFPNCITFMIRKRKLTETSKITYHYFRSYKHVMCDSREDRLGRTQACTGNKGCTELMTSEGEDQEGKTATSGSAGQPSSQ